MKILVVGSGGREHAIAWKMSQNNDIKKIYCAPGNAGTELIDVVENVDVNTMDEILEFAEANKIEFTIVGSEEMLVEGIVDKFEEKGLTIFVPKGRTTDGTPRSRTTCGYAVPASGRKRKSSSRTTSPARRSRKVPLSRSTLDRQPTPRTVRINCAVKPGSLTP